MWFPFWLIRFLFGIAMYLPPKRKKKLIEILYNSLNYGSTKRFVFWRVKLLRSMGAQIGHRVSIKENVKIKAPEKLEIGNDVSINNNCFLSCRGKITIGNDVSIAHGVSILSTTHVYKNQKQIKKLPLEEKPVVVGSNVWIGMNTMILLGVQIGNDVVIGAGSLVKKSIESNSVVAGLPAKKISEVLS